MPKRLIFFSILVSVPVWAETPYFVTYSHQMEEPGNLEIATKGVTGKPDRGSRFQAPVLELEYGLKGWWTTELYLDGQSTAKDSTLFTGVRWENRFRLLPREHWFNPVLYLEYEDLNGADKALLEVVGKDGESNLTEPNREARRERKRELEVKLLLGSYWRGWNVSENFIAEKNLAHAPFEFGYAVGVSRPLASMARTESCRWCPENVEAGFELYGGLGTHDDFGFRGTTHYAAPTVGWRVSDGVNVRISPGFGLTDTSARFLLRFGVSYEVNQARRGVKRWLK